MHTGIRPGSGNINNTRNNSAIPDNFDIKVPNTHEQDNPLMNIQIGIEMEQTANFGDKDFKADKLPSEDGDYFKLDKDKNKEK